MNTYSLACAQLDFFHYYTVQGPRPGNDAAHNGLGQMSMNLIKMIRRNISTGQPSVDNPHWDSLPSDFLGCVKLTAKDNHNKTSGCVCKGFFTEDELRIGGNLPTPGWQVNCSTIPSLPQWTETSDTVSQNKQFFLLSCFHGYCDNDRIPLP